MVCGLPAAAVVNMKHKLPRIDDQAFHAWFDTTYGAAFLELESRQMRSVIPQLYGCRLLQIGVWGWDDTLFEDNPVIRHRWTLGLDHGPRGPVVATGAALPVPSRSMDAVVVPHSLEFVPRPMALLAEVQRMLADHGQMIVLGFNPWGVSNVRHWVPHQRGRFPWCGRPVSVMRVLRALDSFGLEVAQVRRYGVKLPRLSGDPPPLALQRLWAPVSAGYLVVARKRVVPLTPCWRPRPVRPKLKPIVATTTCVGNAAPRHAARETVEA